MTTYAMTPGECLTTGGHGILHGRCVRCGYQRGDGRVTTPPKPRDDGSSTPDDNPHESDDTTPEACAYCGDVWPCGERTMPDGRTIETAGPRAARLIMGWDGPMWRWRQPWGPWTPGEPPTTEEQR